MSVADKAEYIKNEAEKYLLNKYKEPFIPVSYRGKKIIYDFYKVSFKSSKFENYTFDVRVYEDNDFLTFSDNYFKLFMKTDAEKFFFDLAKDVWNKYFVKVRFFSDELPAMPEQQPSFTDYLKNGDCDIDVTFYFDIASSPDKISKLIDRIHEYKFNGVCRLVQLDSFKDIDDLDSLFANYPEKIVNITDYKLKKSTY